MKKWLKCLLALSVAVPVFAAEPKPATETKLDEIVVTAIRTEQSLADSPASADVVTKKEIESRGVKTIDQAVNLLPGVFVRRSKGLNDTLAAITLRGVPDQKRTLILLDGVPMNDGYSGGVNFGGLNPEDLARVEVVRGPSSSLYGGTAMGGVVNFLTRMPEKREFIFKSGYGSSWNRGEAMDDLWGISGSYGDKVGKVQWFASLSYKTTNGYPTDLNVVSSAPPAGIEGGSRTTDVKGATRYLVGDRGDNKWWDYSGLAKVRYEISPDSSILLGFKRSDYKYSSDDPHTFLDNATTGAPVWGYGSSVTERTFLNGVGSKPQNLYSAVYETAFSDVKAKVNASVNDSPGWYTDTAAGATRAGGPGKLSENRMRSYFVDTQVSVPVLRKHLVTVGAGFKQDDANPKEFNLTDYKDPDTKGAMTYEAKGRNRTWSFFAQGEVVILPTLTGYLGFREDWWSTADGYANQVGSTGYPQSYASRSQSSFSPKAALVYRPFEATTVRGSVGKAFRSPGVYDLYRTWSSTVGTKTTVYQSNPELNPETVVAYDLGVEQGLWKGAKVRAAYFRNDFKDLIYSTTIFDNTTAGLKQPKNVGAATSQGVEFDFEERFRDMIGFTVAYTYTDSEITENSASPATVGCRMIQIPMHMVNVGTDITFKPVTLNLSGRYVAKRFSNDDNSDGVNNVYGSRDPYFVADAKAAYKVNEWSTVSIAVNNLFDRKYFDYYVAPGRSWYSEVALKF